MKPHECSLCSCDTELCDHCEGHFEDAAAGAAYTCRPCPATGRLDFDHREQLDYDGEWFCGGCVTSLGNRLADVIGLPETLSANDHDFNGSNAWGGCAHCGELLGAHPMR